MMHISFKIAAFAGMVMLTLPVQADSGHESHGHHGRHGHMQHEFPDPAAAAAPEGVTVSGCWIRALPNRLPAAGYFELRNDGAHDAVLIGAQAQGFDRVMLHTHQTTNGMSAMVHLDKLTIPAGGGLDFSPGGHHVMLEKPVAELEIGTRRPITLWFEGKRALTAECDVRPPGTMK